MSPHSPGPFEPARNVCTQVNSVLSKIKDQSAMKDRGAEGFTRQWRQWMVWAIGGRNRSKQFAGTNLETPDL